MHRIKETLEIKSSNLRLQFFLYLRDNCKNKCKRILNEWMIGFISEEMSKIKKEITFVQGNDCQMILFQYQFKSPKE